MIPTIIAPSNSALPITIEAEIKAAPMAAKKILRLLPRESSSRKSLDFTDAGYVFLNPMHHVLDVEFGPR